MTSCALVLDLRKHCIATEIKKQYNRALSQILRSGTCNETLENGLDMLKQALETLDFPGLRALHPVLSGGSDTVVTLDRKNGCISLYTEGHPIPLVFSPSPLYPG